jgi:hypothetical protein
LKFPDAQANMLDHSDSSSWWDALTDLLFTASNGLDSCVRIVEAACAASRAAPAADPPPANNPNWDAMAVSFASIANGLTWGSIFLAFLAVVVGITWGHIIVSRAETEARDAAKKCAKESSDQWMKENAPDIIAQHLELLRGARASNGDGEAADKIGEGAG